MGVHGLWELLSTVGRRVSVEALANKKLAIDASIWIIQFMKAMRDERGDMLRNAHVLGFFRRICKLLFLRVKPIFVFDGGTPALKRRTVLARRRQRESAQAKIRKTAEKLLLNHLRTKKLEEIMEVRKEESKQTKKSSQNTADLKKDGSVQISDELGSVASTPKANTDVGSSFSRPDSLPNAQESADALLAASLDTEWKEVENSSGGSEDENEELLLLPAAQSRLDPTVLASLPPSMQLNLLVQMREQLVAENRQRFQNVAKEPSSFSQLQIQAYLKTVAFRREVNEVQRVASGKGIGGVPSARIASESDREYIFSAINNGKNVSVTGDSRKVSDADAAVVAETVKNNTTPLPAFGVASSAPPLVLGKTLPIREKAGEESEERIRVTKSPDNPVQTYVDENGHLRVSRVRAMGVRMTRDLQWNLYLLKDKEAQSVEIASKPNEQQTNMQGQNDLQGGNSRALQITFEDNGEGDGGQETEDLFSELVSNQSSIDVGEGSMPEPAASLCLVPRTGLGGSVEDFNNDEIHNLYCQSGRRLNAEGEENIALELNLPAEAERLQYPTCTGNSSKEEDEFEWEEGDIDMNNKPDGAEICEMEQIPPELALREHMGLATTGAEVQGEEDEVEWQARNDDTCRAACSSFIEKQPELIIEKSEEAQLEEAIRRSLKEYSAQTLSNGGHKPLSIGKEHDETPRFITVPCSELDSRDEADQEWKARERKGKAPVYKEDANLRLSDKQQQASTSSDLKGVSPRGGHRQTCSPIETAFAGNGPSSRMRSSGNNEASSMEIEVKEKHFGACANGSWTAPLDGAQCKAEDFKFEGKAGGVVELREYCATLKPLENGADLQLPLVHDSHVEVGIVHDDLEAETKPVKVCSASVAGDDYQKEDKHMAYLLKEAEEADFQLQKQQWEDDLSIERQELELEREKLQAELQAKEELSQAQLENESEMLIQEELELRSAQKKNERNADSVTGEMFAECQELLQMFGVPYVIAPMEAEAQCAFMDSIHLVDGVVTDDSDVFLFGGRNVYKNIFDDRKYVETYYMKDVEGELGLNRENLIHMALLLGSDYTEGVSGIGIVNAIEVVNAFAGEEGLKYFKEWIDTPDLSLLGNLQSITGQKGRSKKQTVDFSHLEGAQEQMLEDDSGFQNEGMDENQSRRRLFMKKHRAISKNWKVPDYFPNRVVIAAYTSPQVDTSSETFTWGRPDLDALRRFCFEKFGWSKDKADDLLLPVLKEYDHRETQLRLEAFYSFNQRFAKIRSRRIQKAVTAITGHRSSELMDFPPNAISSSATKKQRKRKSSDPIGKGSSSKSPSPIQIHVVSKSSEKGIFGHDSPDDISKLQRESLKASRKDTEYNAKRTPNSVCISEETREIKDKKKTRRKEGMSKEVPSCDEDISVLESLQEKTDTAMNRQQLRRSARRRSHTKYMEYDSEGGEDNISADISASLHQSPETASRTLVGGAEEVSEMDNAVEKRNHLQFGGGFISDEEDHGSHEQFNEVMEMENKYEDNACLQAGVGFIPTEETHTNESPEEEDEVFNLGAIPEVHTKRNIVAACPKETPMNLVAGFEVEAVASTRLRAAPFLRRKKKGKNGI